MRRQSSIINLTDLHRVAMGSKASIIGFQLVRLKGLEPTLSPEADFESAASTIPPQPQYPTTLVPTQIIRLMQAPGIRHLLVSPSQRHECHILLFRRVYQTGNQSNAHCANRLCHSFYGIFEWHGWGIGWTSWVGNKPEPTFDLRCVQMQPARM